MPGLWSAGPAMAGPARATLWAAWRTVRLPIGASFDGRSKGCAGVSGRSAGRLPAVFGFRFYRVCKVRRLAILMLWRTVVRSASVEPVDFIGSSLDFVLLFMQASG